MKKPSLVLLFKVFLKISAFTLGGGMTMLPVIQSELVDKRKYLTENDMIDIVALVQSLPGLIAMNIAVMLGYRLRGIMGALVCAAGMVLPPFVVICLVAGLFNKIGDNAMIREAFLGIRAVLCALILLSVIKMAKSVLTKIFPVLIAAAAFVILVVFQELNAVWVVAGAAVLGAAGTYLPLLFNGKTHKNG